MTGAATGAGFAARRRDDFRDASTPPIAIKANTRRAFDPFIIVMVLSLAVTIRVRALTGKGFRINDLQKLLHKNGQGGDERESHSKGPRHIWPLRRQVF